MSDAGFEARLERLFAQPPRVAEPERFAARVEARLEREWSLRRTLIGAAGLIGGVIAVTQTLGAEMYARLGEALGPAERTFAEGWDGSWYDGFDAGTLLTGDAVWAIAALAGLVATLAVARAAEAF